VAENKAELIEENKCKVIPNLFLLANDGIHQEEIILSKDNGGGIK
jgi:hypothetical protein